MNLFIKTTCPICGTVHTLEVREKDWRAYERGALVQDAFPYLFAEEREMLISGICCDCWSKMFDDYPEGKE